MSAVREGPVSRSVNVPTEAAVECLFRVRDLEVSYSADRKPPGWGKGRVVGQRPPGGVPTGSTDAPGAVGNGGGGPTGGPAAVLIVPYLEIPRDRVVFVVGRSGAGKSTLLEILGLMRHHSGAGEVTFYPGRWGPPVRYGEVWQSVAGVAAARREHFRFMFQSSYLFPQFTAVENVALVPISQGREVAVGVRAALCRLRRLGIGSLADRQVGTLSGGEGQRVAFARASLAKGKVLLADEPTGNLDPTSAEAVLKMIRESVSRGTSAVVISHDIDMALKYGDALIILRGNAIDPGCVVDDPSSVTREDVLAMMDGPETPAEGTRCPAPDGCSGLDQRRRSSKHRFAAGSLGPFYGGRSTRDFSPLRWRNLGLLAFLGVTLAGMAFASNGLSELSRRMQDPFVNCVGLEFRSLEAMRRPEAVTGIHDFLLEDSTRARYGVLRADYYVYASLELVRPSDGHLVLADGRAVTATDPVVERLAGTERVVAGSTFVNGEDMGLIVTEDLLTRLGQTYDEGFVYLRMARERMAREDAYLGVPIPIRGVVDRLPGKSEYMSTLWFEESRRRDLNPARREMPLLFYLRGTSAEVGAATDALADAVGQACLPSDGTGGCVRPQPNYPRHQTPTVKGCYAKVILGSRVPADEALSLGQEWVRRVRGSGHGIVQVYGYPIDGSIPDYTNCLSIYVSRLDSVRALRDSLKARGAEIDMSAIEVLENYGAVATLTRVGLVTLLVLSVASVGVFVAYMLYHHLYRSRQCIGLLMAFGVQPGVLQWTYIWRVLVRLLLSIGVACIGFLVIPAWIGSRLEWSWLVAINPATRSAMVLLGAFAAAVLLVSLVSLMIAARALVGKDPGDLVYDRIGREDVGTRVGVSRVWRAVGVVCRAICPEDSRIA